MKTIEITEYLPKELFGCHQCNDFSLVPVSQTKKEVSCPNCGHPMKKVSDDLSPKTPKIIQFLVK